jgi:cytochrome P450
MTAYDPLLDIDADAPYELYRRFRRDRPVYHNEERDLWALFLYEDVSAVLPDWGRFSNHWQDGDPKRPGRGGAGAAGGRDPDRARGKLVEDHLQVYAGAQPKVFFESDPPDHAELRAVIKDPFTPKQVQRFEGHLRTRAVDLLAEHRDGAAFDVKWEFAWPLMMDAVCEMIGIPAGDRPQVTTWLRRIRRDVNDQEAESDLRTFLEELTKERIARPRDDLVSAMAGAPRDLVPLADAVDFSWDFLTGSVESASGAIARGARALAVHPDQLPVLRALDADGMRPAVDEFLRYDAPVRVLPRVPREDVEFRGVRIAAGSEVWVVLGSANRDERVFADPDRLDLRRASTRHIAFGNGIHFCVGAPLTRLAMRVALPQLVAALPEDDRGPVWGTWNVSTSRSRFEGSII